MRFLLLWGPVGLHMVLLFVVSNMSDPGELPGEVSDKTAHFLAYALLSILLLRALAGGRLAGVTWRRAGVAALLATLYGLTDEVHQRFVPGRSAEVADLVADASGAIAGVAVVLLVAHLRDATRRRRGYS